MKRVSKGLQKFKSNKMEEFECKPELMVGIYINIVKNGQDSYDGAVLAIQVTNP
jgi:hypothetical protein